MQDTEHMHLALQRALQGGSVLSEGRYYNDQPVDYLFYQAMAAVRLGEKAQAQQQFQFMVDWANQHRNDASEPDFFAVSLPDLIVLDASAQEQHIQHCLWVEALGYLGLGDEASFVRLTDRLLERNPAHDKAHLLRLALQTGVFNG